MKIGILGGQFNPPHLGHSIIANEALNFTDLDEVWLTPVYKHTFDKNMASYRNRAKMTKLICHGKIKFCNEEIKNQLSGETIELMTILGKKYPQHQFFFIIGSDNLPTFKKWGSWEKLIIKYPFYVVPRPGFNFKLKKYCLDKPQYQFKILKHPLLTITNISATLIRNRLKNKLPISNLVDKKVYEYIDKAKLYQ